MATSRAKLDEFSRLKSKRRFVRLAAFLLTVAIIVFGTLFLLISERFIINEIKVLGVESLPSKDIEDKVQDKLLGEHYLIFPKANIIIYPNEEIQALVENYSHKIKSVDVYRSGFKKITVSIVERLPAYLWCFEEELETECLFADEEGAIYTDAPVFSDPVYVEFYGGLTKEDELLGKSFTSLETFSSLKNLISLLHTESIEVKRIYLEEYGDIKVITNRDFELRFNLSIPIAESVKNLRLSLASENLKPAIVEQRGGIKYIDLRFDKKVYYKFNDE